MKSTTAIAGLSLVLAGAIFSTGVLSQDGGDRQIPDPMTVALKDRLEGVLAEAFESAMAEFRGGRSTPERVIQLSSELFAAQVDIDPGSRSAYAQSCVERVKDIETIMQAGYENGTATKQEWLIAKAARIRAEIEVRSAM